MVNWSKKVEQLGAGEIFLTSIDKDGTMNGLDEKLIDSVVNSVKIPVIASGGTKNKKDLDNIFANTDVSGIAIASALHFDELNLKKFVNKKIVIIDYGVGNIHSLVHAFKYLGEKVEITSDIKKIKNSSHIILPGVGSFGYAINQLRKLDIFNTLKAIDSGKNFVHMFGYAIII